MVLLALVRLGDEAYGVPISREIEERSGREGAVGWASQLLNAAAAPGGTFISLRRDCGMFGKYNARW
jgi:hypothetical protein